MLAYFVSNNEYSQDQYHHLSHHQALSCASIFCSFSLVSFSTTEYERQLDNGTSLDNGFKPDTSYLY